MSIGWITIVMNLSGTKIGIMINRSAYGSVVDKLINFERGQVFRHTYSIWSGSISISTLYIICMIILITMLIITGYFMFKYEEEVK